MFRRAIAMLMLLMTVASCSAQGTALLLCQCSGDVFFGGPPEESCCMQCSESETSLTIAKASHSSGIGCSISSGNCFTVVAKGWENTPPPAAKQDAPSPAFVALAAIVDFAGYTDPVTHDALLVQEFAHRPEPPGRPLLLLYSSLRI